MSTPKNGGVRRTPGLIPGPPRIAFKGRLHIAYNRKFQTMVARSWPTGNGGRTFRRDLTIERFKQMVASAKLGAPEVINQARLEAVGTTFTWRDIVQMASTGRYVILTERTGQIWIGWAVAFQTIQVLLDSIENQPGSILVRAPEGWVVLLPPADLKTLVFDPLEGVPQWGDVSANVQTLLDEISTDEGTMLVRGASAWIALDVGTAGYALVSNGPGTTPEWQPGGAITGGGNPFLTTPALPGFDPEFSGYAGSIVLSNSNKTMTPASGSPYNVAHATPARASGKRYFEGQFSSTTFLALGVSGGAGHNVTQGADYLGIDHEGQVGWRENGSIHVTSSRGINLIGTIDTFTSGDRLSIAVDLDTLMMWCRVNGGNWNASSSNNPATGVGGISCAPALTASSYPLLFPSMSNGNATPASIYLLAADFTHSVPSGFNAWGA